MASNGTDLTLGYPKFPETDAPETGADYEEVARFAAIGPTCRPASAAERAALSGPAAREGVLTIDTSTGVIYQRRSGAWLEVHVPDTGWISLGTLNSGWTATVPAQVRVKNGMVSYSGQLSSTGVGSSPFTTLLPPIARPSLTHAFLAVTTAASLRNAYIAPTGYIDLGAGAVAGIILSAIPSHPAA